MINKKGDFEEDLIEMAAFAKAIAHPARIAILKILASKNSCICGEIVEILPLAQATVSQHLKELKNIGLIHGEIAGTKSCYCIDWAKFNRLMAVFQVELAEIKRSNKSCC